MATDTTVTSDTNTPPIRTLAFEYAHSPNYQCKVCRKSILRKTLCINTIERANKKQKKKSIVPLDSCHFKCWIVPGEFKRKPLEVFRGYSTLKDSDKSKVQRLYEAGPGSSWPGLLAADEEARVAAQEAEAEAAEIAEAQQEEGGAISKKPAQNKSSKPTKRKATHDDDDQDMTKALTGAQAQSPAPDNKKDTSANKKAKKNLSKSTPAKKEKTIKKEAPKPAVKLDDLHGEGFTDDFAKILEDFKQ